MAIIAQKTINTINQTIGGTFNIIKAKIIVVLP
jgi:hypothetical protein